MVNHIEAPYTISFVFHEAKKQSLGDNLAISRSGIDIVAKYSGLYILIQLKYISTYCLIAVTISNMAYL